MLIERYIIKNILKSTLHIVLILSITIEMVLSLRILELLVRKYISFGDFIKVLLYSGQQYIMIALPFAIFIGASNTYNNMAQSKELYILRGMGYSNLKILKPAMISGIIAMFFSLIMQTTTGPLTWSRLQDIIYYSNNNSFLSDTLRPSTFNSIDGKTTTFINDIKGKNVSDIFAKQENKNGSVEILIAKKGFVINKNNEKKVIIFNGIQKNIKDEESQTLFFNQYAIKFDSNIKIKRKREETDDYISYEIYQLMKKNKATKNQISDFWRRLVNPIFILFMSILGGLWIIIKPTLGQPSNKHAIIAYTIAIVATSIELTLFKIAEKSITFVYYELFFIMLFGISVIMTIFIKDRYKK